MIYNELVGINSIVLVPLSGFYFCKLDTKYCGQGRLSLQPGGATINIGGNTTLSKKFV